MITFDLILGGAVELMLVSFQKLVFSPQPKMNYLLKGKRLLVFGG